MPGPDPRNLPSLEDGGDASVDDSAATRVRDPARRLHPPEGDEPPKDGATVVAPAPPEVLAALRKREAVPPHASPSPSPSPSSTPPPSASATSPAATSRPPAAGPSSHRSSSAPEAAARSEPPSLRYNTSGLPSLVEPEDAGTEPRPLWMPGGEMASAIEQRRSSRAPGPLPSQKSVPPGPEATAPRPAEHEGSGAVDDMLRQGAGDPDVEAMRAGRAKSRRLIFAIALVALVATAAALILAANTGWTP